MKTVKAEDAKVGFTVVTTAATFDRLVKMSGLTMEDWSAKVSDLIERTMP